MVTSPVPPRLAQARRCHLRPRNRIRLQMSHLSSPQLRRPLPKCIRQKPTCARHRLILLRAPPHRSSKRRIAVMRGAAGRAKCAARGEVVIHDFKRTTLGHTVRVSYVFGFRLGSPPRRVGDHCREDPMNTGTLLVSVATLLAAAGMGARCAPGGNAVSPVSPTKAWPIAGGASFSALRLESGKWGVAISNAGLASVSRPQPVELEFSPESNPGNHSCRLRFSDCGARWIHRQGLHRTPGAHALFCRRPMARHWAGLAISPHGHGEGQRNERVFIGLPIRLCRAARLDQCRMVRAGHDLRRLRSPFRQCHRRQSSL